MSDEPRIGRYRLLEVSGTGTFATVHRAEDERLGDIVAVKVLAENHSLDADVRERFLQEGRALRRIDSPHVITVHDLGETDRQQPFLVMQYADRGTLADRVAVRRRDGWSPTTDDVLAVARALAEAIDATHAARIVHRDLSPRNVLLRSSTHREDATSGTSLLADATAPLVADDEQLLLADLGLCKDLALHSGLTVAGGTTGFRPPEQREGAGFVGPSADIWSLSALMSWLCTGDPPSDDHDEAARAVTAAGLPTDLADALARGLAHDPADRPEDVVVWFGEVAAALGHPTTSDLPGEDEASGQGSAAPEDTDQAAADTRVGSHGGTPATSTDRSSGRTEGARRRTVAIVAAVVLTVVTIGAVTLGGDRVERTELAGGDVLLERVSDEARLGLAGPDEIVVGQRATFLADHEGITASTWFGPDGAAVDGDQPLTFTALSPGLVRIHLTGVTESGELLRLTHELRARPADD